MSEPLPGLVTALGKLPPSPALTYRGLGPDAGAPDGTLVTQELTATSRDPRVATENFTSAGLFAIAGHQGRDLAVLSQNPGEAEIVHLPGTVLKPVRTFVHDDGLEVHVLEELRPDHDPPAAPAGLPASLEELVTRVRDDVAAALRRAPVTVTTPGKFSGGLR
ncbi:hypothetical protein [Jiangella asiatica]|uniref:Uncharacterized protein n=1 Tax=Jiangella asiatica TaxID=2530372 RepID=A0A4R5CT64_9ACTN|nr:hypothetical protein [Jiangella asiatica]TDE00903.1 hypothetical protein E1269_24220 [Jiangella asiatica]